MKNYSFYNKTILTDDLLNLYNNINVIPQKGIYKIYLNMGISYGVRDKKYLLPGLLIFEIITGQKPVVTRSNKSIAQFLLKKNMVIGCKISLSYNTMYNFISIFKNNNLPNIKDLSFLKKKVFLYNGDYNFGINDFNIFPEINIRYEKFNNITGMDIIFKSKDKGFRYNKIYLSALQLLN